MAAAFGTLTGLDLGGVPVHRGPSVSEQARVHQARAFTRDGEIFLPDEAGPLEHGESRALVAHELAHVVQQRILAPSLPDEDSPDGQQLESEAASAESWYRHGGNPPPRLAHLPIAALLAKNAGRTAGGGYGVQGPGGSTGTGSASPATTSGVQRQGGEAQAATAPVAPHTVAAWPEVGGTTALGTAEAGGPDAGGGGGSHSAVPATAAGHDGTNGPVAAHPDGHAESAQEGPTNREEKPGKRVADLDDPVSLDELARKVYPRLRRLLRVELLADRERAGLLGDLS
ncbi:MAG: DUF4157 domain-containing protein [Streptosporangiaceae bacterium]|jgi:hypothetical protein